MRTLAVFLAFCAASTADARPVSYLGGSSLMMESRPAQSEAMGAYTFDRRAAAGIYGSAYREERGGTTAYAGPIVNALLLRLNEEGRQSNLYAGVSGGGLWDGDKSSRPARAYAGVFDADSETRRFYGSLHHQVALAARRRFAYSRVRLGFSPYLADFGGLHSWVIVQGDYDSWQKRAELTPLLRFFFQNVLWEFGSSFGGKLQLNWAVEI